MATEFPRGAEVYVVVAERDRSDEWRGAHAGPAFGPIVWETLIGEATTLDGARARRASLAGRYGRTWIARLEFLTDIGE